MDAPSLAKIWSRSTIEQGGVEMSQDLKHGNEGPNQCSPIVLLPVKLVVLLVASASSSHP